MRSIPKSPRELTLRDTHIGSRFTLAESQRLLNSNLTAVVRAKAQLDLANCLNDMVPSLNGFDQLPYMPGDTILCKLNLITMKRPRKNPWFRAKLCPCDQRAAVNNAL